MDGPVLLLVLVVAGVGLWLLLKAQAEIARLSARIQDEARAQFQAWRQEESDRIRNESRDEAKRAAEVELADWKARTEAEIREDAINRSRAVTVGKVSEHIVPHLPEFTYNPRDARFLGSPVDFVVFETSNTYTSNTVREKPSTKMGA